MKLKKQDKISSYYKNICNLKNFYRSDFQSFKDPSPIRNFLCSTLFLLFIVGNILLLLHITLNDVKLLLNYFILSSQDEKIELDILDQFPLLTYKDIYVPIDWNRNEFNMFIPIKLYKIGSKNPDRIYILIPGGPGQSALTMKDLGKLISYKNQSSLVILFDHRGTGKSSNLYCRDLQIKEDINIDDYNKCFIELNKKFPEGLKFFNSFQAAKDIEYILSKFPKIPTTIYSVSYGTIVAQRLLKTDLPQIDSLIFVSSSIPNRSNLWKYDKEPYNNFFRYCSQDDSCFKKLKNHTFSSFDKYMENKNNNCNYKDSSLIDKIYSTIRSSLQFYKNNSDIFFKLLPITMNCNENEILKIIKDYSSSKSAKDDDYSFAMHSIIIANELMPRNTYREFPNYKIENSNFFDISKNKKILLITGDIDPTTTSSMSRQFYELLPKYQRLMVNVKNQAHDPLNSLCKIDIILDFNNVNFDITKLNKCSDENVEIISDKYKENKGNNEIRDNI